MQVKAATENLHKPWTPQACAQLRTLHAQNCSHVDMAAALGRTAAAVSKKLTHLGLARKRQSVAWSPHDVATLRKMREEGCRLREIAQALGKTKKAVECKISALSLSPPPRSVTARRPRRAPIAQNTPWERLALHSLTRSLPTPPPMRHANLLQHHGPKPKQLPPGFGKRR